MAGVVDGHGGFEVPAHAFDGELDCLAQALCDSVVEVGVVFNGLAEFLEECPVVGSVVVKVGDVGFEEVDGQPLAVVDDVGPVVGSDFGADVVDEFCGRVVVVCGVGQVGAEDACEFLPFVVG